MDFTGEYNKAINDEISEMVSRRIPFIPFVADAPYLLDITDFTNHGTCSKCGCDTYVHHFLRICVSCEQERIAVFMEKLSVSQYNDLERRIARFSLNN